MTTNPKPKKNMSTKMFHNLNQNKHTFCIPINDQIIYFTIEFLSLNNKSHIRNIKKLSVEDVRVVFFGLREKVEVVNISE